jgi:hypothetical protein
MANFDGLVVATLLVGFGVRYPNSGRFNRLTAGCSTLPGAVPVTFFVTSSFDAVVAAGVFEAPFRIVGCLGVARNRTVR